LSGVLVGNTLDIYSVAGSGRLLADFGTGTIGLDADYTVGGASHQLVGSAAIAADGKGFAGKFDTGISGWSQGNWQGGFFGPNADEVGATGVCTTKTTFWPWR
jgi:hypothetical protein